MTAPRAISHPAADAELTIRNILRAVLQSYRHRVNRVVVSAGIVFGVAAVIASALDDALDQTDKGYLALVLWLAGSMMATLGTTFYAGLLDRVVGEWAAGDEPEPIGKVLRTLPYASLIVADVLIVALSAATYALAIIPGLAIYTLFAIAGPIINIDRVGPIKGMLESARLVRRHFFFVALMVTVPLTIEHTVLHAVKEYVFHDSLGRVFLLNGLAGVVIGSFVGLIEVNVAYALVTRDRAKTAA